MDWSRMVGWGLLFWLGATQLFAQTAPSPNKSFELSAEKPSGTGQADLAVKEETRNSLRLLPGAQVWLKSINGRVDIATTTGDLAEIYVVRSAATKEILATRQLIIETSPERLSIEGKGSTEDGAEVRERIILKLPRQIALTTSGINGSVQVGALTGPLKVSGINGSVTVQEVLGTAGISGVNGSVKVGFRELNNQGIQVSGINGAVQLWFVGSINADLRVSGLNGQVFPNPRTLAIYESSPMEFGEPLSSFKAKLGSGGPVIKVTGVNGSLRLENQ